MEVRKAERLLKALANRRRLGILHYLEGTGPATVGDIAAAINLPLKTTSKHLAILLAVDVVDRKQVGPTVEYFLEQPLHTLSKAALSTIKR